MNKKKKNANKKHRKNQERVRKLRALSVVKAKKKVVKKVVEKDVEKSSEKTTAKKTTAKK